MAIVTTCVIHVDERVSPFLDCLGLNTTYYSDSRSYKAENILSPLFPSVLDFRAEASYASFLTQWSSTLIIGHDDRSSRLLTDRNNTSAVTLTMRLLADTCTSATLC